MEDLLYDIISDLDINFNKKNIKEKDVLKKTISRVIQEASDFTGRKTTDEKLAPYIVDCVKAIWLRRGDEDKDSMSEGGESYVYKNAIKDMKQRLVNIRVLQ